MADFGKCKLTHADGKFVKSHIIPSSFFLIAQDRGSAPLYLLSSDASHPPKKSWDGIYDDHLVIDEGEKYFSAPDTYAYDLLAPIPTRSDYLRDQYGFIIKSEPWQKLGYTIGQFDYRKLRMFFDAILWRMSATDNVYFEAVKFDAEEEIRRYILKREPTLTSLYNVAIMRHLDRWGALNLSPHRWRVDSDYGIKAICGTFTFYFLFGAPNVDDALDEALVKERKSLVILTASLEGTKEFQVARRAVVSTHEKWGR